MSRPPIQLFFFIFISPSLVMLFLYVSYRLRQRQRHAQNLAPAHIVAQLPTRPFKREKSGENDHDECAICLEDYLEGEIIRILPCRHMFHASCVDAWLTTQKKFVSVHRESWSRMTSSYCFPICIVSVQFANATSH